MIQDPLGFAYITDHDYDPNGNETKLTDPKGQVVDFEYDELNRLKKKTYNLTGGDFELYTRTHEITYHYDPNDNLFQIDELKSSGTDPPLLVSSFKSYDALDRLTSETDAWNRPLVYDYDPQGNRILLVDPDNKRTVYGFDALNRLESITLDEGAPGEEVVIYEYFPDNLKKRVFNPNGTVSNYLYDAADRMVWIAHTGPTGTISSYDYAYDENGNREQQIETNAGRTETTLYDYDATDRLEVVTYEAGTATANQVSYTYDLVGNRVTERTVELATSTVTKDVTYAYDAINRLESIDDLIGTEDVLYSYDPNGNTTSKTKNGVTTTFLYDIRNQLGEVRQDTNVLGRYGYDYENLRILKIGDEGIRRYTYDQLSVIIEASISNVTVSKYDYGLDQLVRLNNTSEGRSFFHLDALGSTVTLTELVGSTRQSILYDAWGNERDRVGASASKFTYTGHEKDEETALIYAKARFYDADVGRFLSQDSFLGDIQQPPRLHRYIYANDTPTVFVDPDGHFSLKDFGKGALNVVTEPFKQVYDVALLTGAVALDLDPLSLELQSMLARASKFRAEQGQGAISNALEGSADVATAIGTVGIVPMVEGHMELYQGLEQGELSIDQYDAGVSEIAGGQTAAAVLARLAAGRASVRSGAALEVQPKGVGAVRVVEGSNGTAAVPEGPAIEMVQDASGVWIMPEGPTAPPATALSSRGSGSVLPLRTQPSGLLGAGPQPGAMMLAAPSTPQLPQDVSSKPTAPPALPLTRRIGSSSAQHAELQRDIANAQAQGATNIRVNQQQLDAAGERVGINRPDLQYTRPDGTRVHIEYDPPVNGRGRVHSIRILANDPEAVVETKTIK